MKSIFQAAAGLLLALALAAQADEIRVEPRVQAAAKAHADKTRSGHARAAHIRPVVLSRPAAVAKSEAVALPGTPLQIGSGREVAELEVDAAAALTWDDVGTAKVAAFSITSPGASALRAGLRIHSLPESAVLRFYGNADDELVEVGGKEILATLAGNQAAGDESENAHTFWSPAIEAETIVVEIELPAGVNPAALQVAVPYVTHMTSSVKFASVTPGRSATCEVDASCSIATWGSQMNSVAHLQFQIGASGYICTGTLLADQDSSSNIPYFLTANHCISDQTTANTVETWWFYRSASCGSTSMNAAVRLTGGATLLYNTSNTDTSFMRLNGVPPSGAVFSGWIVTTPSLGSLATGIHHPMGDMQKISFGNIAGHWTCTPASGGQFSCNQSTAASGTFYSVTWRQGITEGGSSGSGIFLDNGKYLVGQLYGGSSGCALTGQEFYGRLDVAYNARLNTWLGPPAAPASGSLTVSRLGSGTGSVTSQPAGLSCGATCTASFANNTPVTLTAVPAGGSMFAGWTGACAGSLPSCTVMVSGSTAVAATFYSQQTLTVSRIGTGTGTVTSSPSGISCGATCSVTYISGIAVTLTATPSAGQYFLGWGGACSGTGLCTVAMNGPVAVTANFSATAPLTPSIAVTVNGSGLVNAADYSIFCSTACTVNYPSGSVVTLTARGQNGTAFTGWSGACSGTSPTCTLTVSTAYAVTATFGAATPPPPPPSPTQLALTVARSGTGSGSVVSSPAGISCGATCSASFAQGTPVTLTATPASGSTFSGWSGACSGTGSCVVPMSAATSVTAGFALTPTTPPPPPTGTPSIAVTVNGSGIVNATDYSIFCSASCTASYPAGSVVTLTARGQNGTAFSGWSGACTGTSPTCTLSVNGALAVTASFGGATPPPPPAQQTLSVAMGGTGSGSVVSSPAGISCGAACSASFATGTSVSLTATAASGSTFTGWSGACSGTSACVVALSAAASVTATFTADSVTPPPPPPPVTGGTPSITVGVTGMGLVTTADYSLFCSGTCTANYPAGTLVTLSARGQNGRAFIGWGGACAGSSPSCTLAVTGALSVSAQFAP